MYITCILHLCVCLFKTCAHPGLPGVWPALLGQSAARAIERSGGYVHYGN